MISWDYTVYVLQYNVGCHEVSKSTVPLHRRLTIRSTISEAIY